MNKEFQSVIKPILALISVLAFVHVLLAQNVLPDLYQRSNYWLIYVYMVPLTIMAQYYLVREFKKSKGSLGKNFMIYMVIKTVTSIMFLSPWLFNKDEFSRPIVYQFFLLFFPVLFIETWMLVRLLNDKFSKAA